MSASAAASSSSSAVRAFATEILKQHSYKSTALPQLRSFEHAWKESKDRVRELVEAGGVRGPVKVSLAPGADVYVVRKRKVVPGAVTKKRLEVFTSRALREEELESLRRLAEAVRQDAIAREEREQTKREKDAEAAARKAERESKKRAREEAKVERDRMKEIREAAKAEREEVKRRRSELKEATTAAKEVYERRVRQVQRVIHNTS